MKHGCALQAILRYFNPGRPDATLCHGSLISERFVLTTALCANFAYVSYDNMLHIIHSVMNINIYDYICIAA